MLGQVGVVSAWVCWSLRAGCGGAGVWWGRGGGGAAHSPVRAGSRSPLGPPGTGNYTIKYGPGMEVSLRPFWSPAPGHWGSQGPSRAAETGVWPPACRASDLPRPIPPTGTPSRLLPDTHAGASGSRRPNPSQRASSLGTLCRRLPWPTAHPARPGPSASSAVA